MQLPESSSVQCLDPEGAVADESAEMEEETEPLTAFIDHEDAEWETDSPKCGRCPRYRIVGSVLLIVVAAIISLQVALNLSSRVKVEVADSPPVDEPHAEAEVADSPPVEEPQVHYEANGKKCFGSSQELKDAVDSYVLNKENETLAEIYGLPIGVWCVKYVEDFSFLFATERNALVRDFNDDISGWDMSSAVSLERMFRENYWFNQNLNSWNTSNVKTMRGMFVFTRMFDGDIRAWDVSKVTIFSAMFFEAQRFNRNLKYWNVSSATDMTSMFRGAARFNHELCDWGPQLKSTTDTTGMFFNSACPPESSTRSITIVNKLGSVPGPFCYECH